jgi:signal transduction histidine kinase
MCRRIVTRLGGRIWIADSGPPGLAVRLTIPTVASRSLR